MKFYFFEIRYWLKQPMTWIFMGINALMIFGATSSDSIQVGGSFGNIYKNAPFVIQNYYAVMSLITLLMTTSFIAASTLRDFTNDTYQIIFSTPVKRMKYLLARFAGTITVSVIPMLGISLGIIIGCLMPWVDAEKIGCRKDRTICSGGSPILYLLHSTSQFTFHRSYNLSGSLKNTKFNDLVHHRSGPFGTNNRSR